MKKISDFNSSTEKYPVIYAGSATRPEFVDMPTTLQQQEGVAPMDTLPAQWWNAMWKLATKDINAFRDYVGDSITEINNLLTKFGITLDDADSEQLYDFFHNDYVQNYLNDIFVNKSGDTINGDLHIKGNLSVDGIGEEIISTELKVGSNTITLRDGNPTALGDTELAGVVTENYDGNNHNNIISIDKNGVARTGDIDIATRILYSNNGTNFFTDEKLTIPATIGTDEKVRDTGNQTSGGVKIYEGITYSNDDTQALATREDNPVDGALMKWNAATKKLVSANIETGVPVDVVEDGNMRAVTSNAVASALENKRTINPATNIDFSITKNNEVNFYKLPLNTISIAGIKSALIAYGFNSVPSGTSIIEFMGAEEHNFTVILSHSGASYFGGIVITYYFPLTYIKYNKGTWN